MALSTHLTPPPPPRGDPPGWRSTVEGLQADCGVRCLAAHAGSDPPAWPVVSAVCVFTVISSCASTWVIRAKKSPHQCGFLFVRLLLFIGKNPEAREGKVSANKMCPPYPLGLSTAHSE